MRAYGSPGYLGFAWVHSCPTKGRRVHSSSHGLTGALLNVSGLIRVSVGTLGRSFGSSGSFAFSWVHSGPPSIGRVHSCS